MRVRQPEVQRRALPHLPGGPTPVPPPAPGPDRVHGRGVRWGGLPRRPVGSPAALHPQPASHGAPAAGRWQGSPAPRPGPARPRPRPGLAWLRGAAAPRGAASAPCGAASQPGWEFPRAGRGPFFFPPPGEAPGRCRLPPAARAAEEKGLGAAQRTPASPLANRPLAGSGTGAARPSSTTAVEWDGHFFYYY